ncbi:hypothetical protein GUITHDRAFT_40201, partial [Guillardia theta CCMP2712]
LKEGKAEVLHKPGEAFYNPAQVQNRDLSIAVLREFFKLRDEEAASKKKDGKEEEKHQRRVLEGLSATGLRAIRYAKEIEGLTEVVANDFSAAAVESIDRNVKHNKVEEIVKASHADASLLMHKAKQVEKDKFDVVDLDPYGSATPFLDAAVQAVNEGGLLAVTCTDLAVLCGNHSEACFAKYGCTSLRGKHCHELAIRIVLSSIESHANRYKRHIVPLLGVYMDFYVRVFVRVYTSASAVKWSASKQSMVFQCTGCGAYHLQPLGKVVERGNSIKFLPSLGPPVGELCELCGYKHQLGGPMWSQPYFQPEFVGRVRAQLWGDQAGFASYKRVCGLLTALEEELVDQPLFYDLSVLASLLNVVCPSNAAFAAPLLKAGYRLSHSHTSPMAMKTDAPVEALWDIMRGWVKDHPVKKLKEGSPGFRLLQQESKHIVDPDFTVTAEQRKEDKASRSTPKYMPNPTPDWG